MAPSVPTPKDFITSFPNPVAKLKGAPTYDNLTAIRNLLKANATSVPSNRGGSANGYLGLVILAAIYTTINGTALTL
jgi:hypothetical protein